MSRARAPGKLVLSGAYAVLSGAPALVAAVDRYVLADTARPANFQAPEVLAALREDGAGSAQAAPWYDASELRDGGQKLGLGSSAAIVVASLAALELDTQPNLTDDALCALVYQRALVAHRAAQGGGSGVDVAASAHGGVLSARRVAGALELSRVALPSALYFEVWACSAAASTAEFLARIRELGVRDPSLHRARLDAQARAAEAALRAVLSGSATDFVTAVAEQVAALGALGEAASVPIVTAEHGELAALAAAHGAAFLPAGAGGGDVAYYVGTSAPPPEFGARGQALGLRRLALALGARGVHRL